MAKEYIEREALKTWLHEEDFGTPDERWRPESEFGAMIDALPAADVVEVVRCGQCKHWKINPNNLYGGYCRYCEGAKIDHFCSYGERKERG